MHPRIAWLGALRRKAICGTVASHADAWLQDWCLQRTSVALGTKESIGALSPPRELLAWTVDSAPGSLLLAIDARQIGALGRRLAAITLDVEPSIAPDLARLALEDLLVRMAPQPKAKANPWNDAWPESATRAEWGALAIEVTLDGIKLVIAMDRVVGDAICPPKAANQNPSCKRSEALESTRTLLTATLNFGEMDARDIAGLRVGEVLISERKLGQSAELKVGETRVADAALGRMGTRLAVVMAASNAFQEKS